MRSPPTRCARRRRSSSFVNGGWWPARVNVSAAVPAATRGNAAAIRRPTAELGLALQLARAESLPELPLRSARGRSSGLRHAAASCEELPSCCRCNADAATAVPESDVACSVGVSPLHDVMNNARQQTGVGGVAPASSGQSTRGVGGGGGDWQLSKSLSHAQMVNIYANNNLGQPPTVGHRRESAQHRTATDGSSGSLFEVRTVRTYT